MTYFSLIMISRHPLNQNVEMAKRFFKTNNNINMPVSVSLWHMHMMCFGMHIYSAGSIEVCDLDRHA